MDQIEEAKFFHDMHFGILSLQKITKENDQEFVIICDNRGLFTLSIEETREIANELQKTVQNITNKDLLRYEKETLLSSAPEMFPQIYGDNDPLWVAYLQSLPEKQPYKKEKKAEKPGVVYIIRGDAYYKIGRTTSHHKRISAIGIKSPFQIQIILLIETPTPIKLEKELHARFASKRTRGEWFDLLPADIEEINGAYHVVDPSTYDQILEA